MSATASELVETFPCFGSECTVIVANPDPARAAAAVAAARGRLLEWHRQFSRFEPDSELSRLNRDPRETVPISPMMRRIIEAGIAAAERTGGLVDPTLVDEIERAGYAADLGLSAPAAAAARSAGPAGASGAAEAAVASALSGLRPAGAHPQARWRRLRTDRRSGTVTRPPGVKFDSGGIAKGVFADELAAALSAHDAFVVDCGGDLRLGGAAAVPRDVHVAAPAGGEPLHTFTFSRGAVATSGIARRAWLGSDGHLAHHLLDPRTGRPAFTGVVQATALAPTAAEAETLSKAALLSGPGEAAAQLRYGGVIVTAVGAIQVLAEAWPSSQPHRSSSTRSCSGSLKISW